jgi:hypothetical protein
MFSGSIIDELHLVAHPVGRSTANAGGWSLGDAKTSRASVLSWRVPLEKSRWVP